MPQMEDTMIFSFFGLFGGKKPALKLKDNQEIEIEFYTEESGYETHFTHVLDIQRKSVIVKSPGTERRPIRVIPGQRMTVTTLENNVMYSFETQVLDAGEREFDIKPPENVKEEKQPSFDENCQIEVPITVEYRAMNSAHHQVAQTFAITNTGLILMTNLPIPSGTTLKLEIEIPGAMGFSTSGNVIGSKPHPNDKKKHLCEIEYVDLSKQDINSILRYALYSKKRLERKAKRDELEAMSK